MKWKLNQVEDTECTPDDSGVYVVINRIAENQHSKGYFHTTVRIRVDVMLVGGDIALQSFVGEGNAVRKVVIRWLNDYYVNGDEITSDNENKPDTTILEISCEHASYIGYEIARAMLDEHYTQA